MPEGVVSRASNVLSSPPQRPVTPPPSATVAVPISPEMAVIAAQVGDPSVATTFRSRETLITYAGHMSPAHEVAREFAFQSITASPVQRVQPIRACVPSPQRSANMGQLSGDSTKREVAVGRAMALIHSIPLWRERLQPQPVPESEFDIAVKPLLVSVAGKNGDNLVSLIDAVERYEKYCIDKRITIMYPIPRTLMRNVGEH